MNENQQPFILYKNMNKYARHILFHKKSTLCVSCTVTKIYVSINILSYVALISGKCLASRLF